MKYFTDEVKVEGKIAVKDTEIGNIECKIRRNEEVIKNSKNCVEDKEKEILPLKNSLSELELSTSQELRKGNLEFEIHNKKYSEDLLNAKQ